MEWNGREIFYFPDKPHIYKYIKEKNIYAYVCFLHCFRSGEILKKKNFLNQIFTIWKKILLHLNIRQD